jgi:hypothetical protein
VTAADIQRVAKQYMGTGRIQLIAVGERKEIEEGLAKYGPITVLTPEQVTNPAPTPAFPRHRAFRVSRRAWRPRFDRHGTP